MAKKKSVAKKINLGAIVAFVGALVAFIAFFIPQVVQKELEVSLNGIDLSTVLLGAGKGLDNLDIQLAVEALKAINSEATQSLMIFTFVGVIVAGLYMLYSLVGIFVKDVRSKLLNLIFAGVLLGVGIAVISSAGALQAGATKEILGETIVALSMSAGPFMTAIGGGIGVLSFLFYKK